MGLNPASRTQATTQPTTGRVIRAFRNLTVTVITGPDGEQRHISLLNATQQQILQTVLWLERRSDRSYAEGWYDEAGSAMPSNR